MLQQLSCSALQLQLRLENTEEARNSWPLRKRKLANGVKLAMLASDSMRQLVNHLLHVIFLKDSYANKPAEWAFQE
jgi:hypothetical protein